MEKKPNLFSKKLDEIKTFKAQEPGRILKVIQDLAEIVKASIPIKGKDYFDGKDGYTPRKGIDYFDGEKGEDGYTPIKGKDYFDGKDADEETIVQKVLKKIVLPDFGKFKKEILSSVNRKPDLKVIQEKIETDPMSVIDKILALPEDKFKLKLSQIDGLEQTIAAFRSQITSKGYLHGGGITEVKHDSTMTGKGTTDSPLSVVPTSIFPTGGIIIWSGFLSNIPAGWALCDGTGGTPNLINSFIKGVATNATNPGTTGGSATANYTPAGTVDQPTFTGTSNQSTSAVSAGTPAGSVSAPTFTGSSATTSSVSAGTPSGTNANESSHTHSVTSNVSGTITPAGTVAWPVGVPTNAGGAFTEGAISWPVGVPTFAGTTNQALTLVNNAVTSGAGSAHSHGVGTFAVGAIAATATAAVKVGTSASSAADNAHTHPAPTFTGTSASESAHTHSVTSNVTGTLTPGGTISWPAGVPTIAAGSFTQPTISWPAGVPTFTGTTSQAVTMSNPAVTSGAGTAHTHTFTGDPLSGHTHTVTATGTNSAPTFTGSALGTHTHTFTAAGIISQPAFTGTPATIATEPVFYSVAFIIKL